jgi:hypothetical protein
MYKLIKHPITQVINCVKKENDNVTLVIPFELANTDYQAYLAWLEEGNVPLPAEE